MGKKKTTAEHGKTVGRSLKVPVDVDKQIADIAKSEDRPWSYIVIRAMRREAELTARASSGKPT